MIETSQTDLIWLDFSCTISRKKARRTGKRMISIFLGILVFDSVVWLSKNGEEGGEKNKN